MAVREASPVADRPALGLRGVTALLVVRDPRGGEQIAHRIAASGAEVLHARSADDALRQLRAHRPGVIACELELADADGIHLVRRIRARSPADGGRTPAIALLSKATRHLETRARLAGYQEAVSLDASELELRLALAGTCWR